MPLKSKSRAEIEEKQPVSSCWGSSGFGLSGCAPGSSLQPMLFSVLRLLPHVTEPEWELASCSHLEIMTCSTAAIATTTCFYKDLYPEVLKMTSTEDLDCVSTAHGGIKS